MVLYLGIDPGKTTGTAWVRQNEDGKIGVLDFADIEWPKFGLWVDQWQAHAEMFKGHPDERIIVICEDFIQRDTKGGEWVQQATAKQVGACWLRAFQLGWKYVEQQPSVKPVGYKLFGMPNKHKHYQDAIAHCYYAANAGIPSKQKVIWD
jgi:hypothetical protein